MNDARHTFLMFAPDFCNAAYADHALYGTGHGAVRAAVQGPDRPQTVEHSKQILAIVIAFGGQWPHSTYMMPGGVTCPLDEERLAECSAAIDAYADWYERVVLGCTIDDWLVARQRRRLRRLARDARPPRRRARRIRPLRPLDRPAAAGQGHFRTAQHRLLLRPRALAAAVRRATVPAARRVLRRRARRDRAVLAPSVSEHLRYACYVDPGGGAPSLGQPDHSGVHARRGLQLRQGDALRGSRRPARTAGGPRDGRRPADRARSSQRQGRARGCGSSPGCTAPS